MKFDVKPVLTVGGASAQDVSAACNLKFNHDDNEINVRHSCFVCYLLVLSACALGHGREPVLPSRDLIGSSSRGQVTLLIRFATAPKRKPSSIIVRYDMFCRFGSIASNPMVVVGIAPFRNFSPTLPWHVAVICLFFFLSEKHFDDDLFIHHICRFALLIPWLRMD